MNRKEKKELLKKNLFNNIELRVNGIHQTNSQLFFGCMCKDVFKDLSSSYHMGKLDEKRQYQDLGFYVKSNGFPIKVDLNKDNVYEKGGEVIVEKA